MSANNGRPQRARVDQRRRAPGKPQSGNDIWRLPTAEQPEIEPIAMSVDVGALLRSLGDPPMVNGTAAGHYFDAVVQRSAATARALAYIARVLDEPDLT